MKLGDWIDYENNQTPEKVIEDMLSPFSRYFKGNLDYDIVSSPDNPEKTYKRAKEIFGSSTKIVSQEDIDQVNRIILVNIEKIDSYIDSFGVDTATTSIIYNSLKEIQKKYSMLQHVLYIEAKRWWHPVNEKDILYHQQAIDVYMKELYGEKLSDTPDERNITIDYIDRLDTSKLTEEEHETLSKLITELKGLWYDPERVKEIYWEREQILEEQSIRHRIQMFKHFWRWNGTEFIPLEDFQIQYLLSKSEDEITQRMNEHNIHTNAPATRNKEWDEKIFTYEEYIHRKEKLETTEVDIETRITIINKILEIYGEKFPETSIHQWESSTTHAAWSSSQHDKETIYLTNKRVRTILDFLEIEVGHELELHAGKGANTNDHIWKWFIGAWYRDIEEWYARIFELITAWKIQSVEDIHLHTLPSFHPAMLSTALAEQFPTSQAVEYLRIIKKAAWVAADKIDKQVESEINKAKRFRDDDLPGANRVLINAYVRWNIEAAKLLKEKWSLEEIIHRYNKTHIWKIGVQDIKNITLIDTHGNHIEPLFIGYLIRELLLYGTIQNKLLPIQKFLPGLWIQAMRKCSSIRKELEKILQEQDWQFNERKKLWIIYSM